MRVQGPNLKGMTTMRAATIAALAGFAGLVMTTVGAHALPAAPLSSAGERDVTRVGLICPYGWHLSFRVGRCVSNGYYAPPRRACPWGYHLSRYSRRCVPN